MTMTHTFAFPRRNPPELCMNFSRLERTEGAGNAGRSTRPQPRVPKQKKHTSVVTTVTPEITRHSPRLALSPVTRLV
jgi:hypothetical protein